MSDEVDTWQQAEEADDGVPLIFEEEESSARRKLYLYVFIAVAIVFMIVVVVAVTLSTMCEETLQNFFDRAPNVVSSGMKRVRVSARPDYQSKVESLGLIYHDEPSLLWSECEQ